MYNLLLNYLNLYNILPDNQYGFQEAYSTCFCRVRQMFYLGFFGGANIRGGGGEKMSEENILGKCPGENALYSSLETALYVDIVTWTNIPRQNLHGKTYPDKIYRIKHIGQNVHRQYISNNIYRIKYTEQNIPDKIYWTKNTGQNWHSLYHKPVTITHCEVKQNDRYVLSQTSHNNGYDFGTLSTAGNQHC